MPGICQKVGSPQKPTKGQIPKKETYQHLARFAKTGRGLTY